MASHSIASGARLLSSARGSVCLTGLLVVGFVLPLACARNPVTGRPEAVLTSEAGEIEQGAEAAKMVEAQIGLLDDEALAAYIDQLGQRLAAQSPRGNLVHTFNVVEMKEPNAFALPGGHIYVSRGLLALVNSEDELANVIGHEIGHVAARHSVSRQTASAPLAPVRILAGIGGAAASIVSPSIGRLVSGVGQLPGALALAAYSREQEREADQLGQEFAAASGFDPEAMSTFMATLAREEELSGSDPNRQSFLRTHPRSPERAEAAQSRAETITVTPTDPGPLTRSAFLGRLDGLPVGDAASEGIFVDERFIQPDLGFAMTFPEGWETQNTRNAVGAVQKDQLGQIVVEIVAEGTDAMEQALAFDKQVRLDGTPKRLEIAGLSAAEAETQIGGRGNRMRLLLTWIAHDGIIYRVSGGSSPRHFGPLRSKFSDTAASFHPITDAERKEVHQDRLRLVTAAPGETLADLAERAENNWTIEQTAVANGLEADAELRPGNLIKISRSEPYTAREKKEETAEPVSE